MRAHALFLFGILITGGSLAQPVLNTGAISFTPGDLVLWKSCEIVSPGAAGPNQVWDMSDLICGAAQTTAYSAPGSSPYSADYPEATVARSQGPVTHFYRSEADTFSWVGAASSVYTITCSSGKELMHYPFGIGSEFNDYTVCTQTGTPNTILTYVTHAIADGHGTLVMPFGTVNNVLRIWWRDSGGDGSYLYVDTAFFFIRPGVKEPIVSIWKKTEFLQGSPIVNQYSTMVDQSIVGVKELLLHEIGIDVMPNPATDRVEVLFGVGAGKRLNIELIDLTGKTVMSTRRTTQVNTVQREILELTGLPSGAYTVRVTDETGAMGAKRLVVN